tara:strand:+ start:1415 stop:1597 length:183 start_codon:yes stop_codon:yes gene_type:complete
MLHTYQPHCTTDTILNEQSTDWGLGLAIMFIVFLVLELSLTAYTLFKASEKVVGVKKAAA